MCNASEEDEFACFIELYKNASKKFDMPLLYISDYEHGSSYYIPLLRIGESVTSAFLIEYIESDYKGPSDPDGNDTDLDSELINEFEDKSYIKLTILTYKTWKIFNVMNDIVAYRPAKIFMIYPYSHSRISKTEEEKLREEFGIPIVSHLSSIE